MHITRHTPFEELPQFLSPKEGWTWLGMGRSTVYDAIRRGEIPHIRIGRCLRIPKIALGHILGLSENGEEDAVSQITEALAGKARASWHKAKPCTSGGNGQNTYAISQTRRHRDAIPS